MSKNKNPYKFGKCNPNCTFLTKPKAQRQRNTSCTHSIGGYCNWFKVNLWTSTQVALHQFGWKCYAPKECDFACREPKSDTIVINFISEGLDTSSTIDNVIVVD